MYIRQLITKSFNMPGAPSYASFIDAYSHDKNTSRNILTRFEIAKLVGVRSEQLARGAKPTVDILNLKNVRDIAIKELKEKKIPFVIARPLPNGKKEYWRIEDVIIDPHQLQ